MARRISPREFEVNSICVNLRGIERLVAVAAPLHELGKVRIAQNQAISPQASHRTRAHSRASLPGRAKRTLDAKDQEPHGWRWRSGECHSEATTVRTCIWQVKHCVRAGGFLADAHQAISISELCPLLITLRLTLIQQYCGQLWTKNGGSGVTTKTVIREFRA